MARPTHGARPEIVTFSNSTQVQGAEEDKDVFDLECRVRGTLPSAGTLAKQSSSNESLGFQKHLKPKSINPRRKSLKQRPGNRTPAGDGTSAQHESVIQRVLHLVPRTCRVWG